MKLGLSEAQWVKPPFTMPVSQMEMLVQIQADQFPSNSLSMHLEKQRKMTKELGPLPCMWGT